METAIKQSAIRQRTNKSPERSLASAIKAGKNINKNFDNASFNANSRGGGSKVEVDMGLETKVKDGRPAEERRISRAARNRLLAIASVMLVADAVLSIAFALLSPADPRLTEVFASRRQQRTIVIQGVVAAIDALVSFGVCIHVVQGILSASLGNFLEAAATKLLQAIFFSLLQTGYPTLVRLALVSVLLLLRVASASLVFRAAFLSGILTARPSRELPRLIVSLLEMGAPVVPPGANQQLQRAQMYALERPLTIELVERLIRWLVPARERAAAVGIGRRQVLVIACFLLIMTGYAAFNEYWCILGDQDEFFVEGQREQITTDSFAYLSAAAYAVGQSSRTVKEAKPFLPSNVTLSQHRVVVVVLSGLRYDALEEKGPTDAASLYRWHESLGPEAVLCKMTSEIPSLDVPNWMALLMGLRPEIHGLLGNRGAAEQPYSSLLSVTKQLDVPATVVGTPWFVDLVRSQLAPLKGDGSASASYSDMEDHTSHAAHYDGRRAEALMKAMNTTSRLIVAQFADINAAGYKTGARFADGTTYSTAIKTKAAVLARIRDAMDLPGAPPTTLLVVSDHGHLQRGGSGGASKPEREVPLIAYRRGSSLRDRAPVETPEGDACRSGDISTIDLAPSIAGLLGVPVPRHSQGRFIPALFDDDEAQGYGTEAAYAAVQAKSEAMGSQLFRRLAYWQWKDLYYQQHAFVANFLVNPEVNSRGMLDALDSDPDTIAAKELAEGKEASAASYSQLVAGLDELYAGSRNGASSATSARNSFVAFFILGLILLLVLFAMQLQTFCDPLIIFTCRCTAKVQRTKDFRAARFTFLLCAGYYVGCIAIFILWLIIAQLYWSSSIVALPQNVRNFLLLAILPGAILGYGIYRAILLQYAVWPRSDDGRNGLASVATLATFILVDEVQAFEQVDMLYLAHFYALFWALLTSCILGVLSSRFSFIVPLVFYNKYVDAELWEYRFTVMTVQIMTVPLLMFLIFALYRWPQTRVDLRAMDMIHKLKVAKADRRRGTEEGDGSFHQSKIEISSMLSAAAATDAEAIGLNEKATAVRSRFGLRRKSKEQLEEPPALSESQEERAARFDKVHQMLLEEQQEQIEMGEEMTHLLEKSESLQDEYEEIISELQANQTQINAGVKELETLIIRRFEKMQEAEDEVKRVKEARDTALSDAQETGGGDGAADDDDQEMHGLDPAARRQLRRQRLVSEQRKRIAEEEAEKAEADAKIRSLQAELAKLLEANGRLQRKVEACEHNIDETRDAIEDMGFQKSQCDAQKENQLAVLTGEASYLNEHQATVQRKASELTSKMAEIESAISASGYKLQRVTHQNELATADRRRELDALRAETGTLKGKFEQVRDDVKVLYTDKAKLNQQLLSAQAEAADVAACVTQYRRSVANLIA